MRKNKEGLKRGGKSNVEDVYSTRKRGVYIGVQDSKSQRMEAE
jgi:hypothetical protein